MKKFMKFFTALGCFSLMAGFFVGAIEKRAIKERPGKIKHQSYGLYEEYFKRPFDFALALFVLTLLLPVLLILALLVKVKMGAPVIFVQKRPGRNGKIFRLYKFRTMTEERGKDGMVLSDEERMTAFGKKLRSCSLDELPELFNILKGEMALVGPRPLLVEYLPRYNERQARRHEVLPGLTGLAQVNGRNKLSWEERLEDDVQYVDCISFVGDLKIILKTIVIVLKKEGINSETSATMEKFQGISEQRGIL